jgi:N-acetylglucosaminyldiphosphoundecaprenol N-acetyl-beta-D-mannosaminyltransferase
MTKSFWPIVELCGLPLAQLDREQVIDAVFAALARGEGGWLLTANLDHLRNYALNQDIRDLYAGADMIVADGMPLLWAARLQGRSLPERVAGSDLVWSLAERSAKEGRSIYLLGGNAGAAEGACRILQDRYPGLKVAGYSNPHVSSHPSPEDLASIRRDIEAANPDIVYVALGAPKQERVINLLRGVLPTVWMIGVGISLSFISGEVRRAPVWLQRLGLEWCHRMAQEPGRLAARYLVKDLPFGVWLLAHAWTRRQR